MKIRAAFLLGALAACAGEPPPTLDEIFSDVRLDTLPGRGRITVSGQDLGPAPATLHVQAGHTYAISAELSGFESRTISGTSEELLKNRSMELVLVPQGFGAPAPLNTDAVGLSAIAEQLEHRKDWGHASEFWRRVIVLTPRSPRAHKGLGSCYAKLGHDELAIREYTQYLFLDPDAPDADRVRKAIDAFRGGIEIKPDKPEE